MFRLPLRTPFSESRVKGHLTMKMASAPVVETLVAKNSPSQDSNHPDDLSQSKDTFQCQNLCEIDSFGEWNSLHNGATNIFGKDVSKAGSYFL